MSAPLRRKRTTRFHDSGDGQQLSLQERVTAAYDDLKVSFARLGNPRDTEAVYVLAGFSLIIDVVISLLVVNLRPYTEIDWSTYMQQVECYIKGEYNYSSIKGDTGPIVYPAAHIWVYWLLYHLTNDGRNIFVGQCIFLGIYLANQATVFYIYIKSKRIPPFVFPFVVLIGYRIHSIYMLRMFNDGVSMLCLYAAIASLISTEGGRRCNNSFLQTAACFFSFAVGIKMNVLLFAPVFYALILFRHGWIALARTIVFSGIVQVVTSLPFLTTYPVDYLTKAFNFKRVFLYEWTVNWKFLPESVFVNSNFHLFLILMHVGLLAVFTCFLWFRKYGGVLSLIEQPQTVPITKHDMLIALFTSNFLGIAFSRSLHYQFYSWYYHTIPYFLFSSKSLHDTCARPGYLRSIAIRIIVMIGLEYCWNAYPPSATSSLLLHFLHAFILFITVRSSITEAAAATNNGAAEDHLHKS